MTNAQMSASKGCAEISDMQWLEIKNWGWKKMTELEIWESLPRKGEDTTECLQMI